MSQNFGILNQLPSELSYLASPAMRYGIHQFDDDIDQFLSNATTDQMSEIAAIAEKVRLNDHYPAINEWLDRFEIDDYKEAANLYFLFGMMDAAGLSFEPD